MRYSTPSRQAITDFLVQHGSTAEAWKQRSRYSFGLLAGWPSLSADVATQLAHEIAAVTQQSAESVMHTLFQVHHPRRKASPQRYYPTDWNALFIRYAVGPEDLADAISVNRVITLLKRPRGLTAADAQRISSTFARLTLMNVERAHALLFAANSAYLYEDR